MSMQPIIYDFFLCKICICRYFFMKISLRILETDPVMIFFAEIPENRFENATL